MQQPVRLLVAASCLLLIGCLCFSWCSASLHRPVCDSLVDEWIDIALARRHLAGLNAAKVLMTPEEYERDLSANAVAWRRRYYWKRQVDLTRQVSENI